MTDKHDGMEVVAWQWLNTANFRRALPKDAELGAWNALVHLTSAQAAVDAERKRWEEATLSIKAIGDINADSDCARITALEAALRVARTALEAECGGRCNAEYNPCHAREAIALIDTTLGSKT